MTVLYSTKAGPSATISPPSTLTKEPLYSQLNSKPMRCSTKQRLLKSVTSPKTSLKLWRRWWWNREFYRPGPTWLHTECLFFLAPPRYHGLPPDREAFEMHIAALARKLDVYEKILSKQKYVAGDVGVSFYHNYLLRELLFIQLFFFWGLGNHTSRPLSCRFGICGFKNGKRRVGIGFAAKCQEVRRTQCFIYAVVIWLIRTT